MEQVLPPEDRERTGPVTTERPNRKRTTAEVHHDPIVVTAVPNVSVVTPKLEVPVWAMVFLGVFMGLQALGLFALAYVIGNAARQQRAVPGIHLQQDANGCTFQFVP